MGVSVPAIRECNITCLSLQYVHKEQEDEGRKRYEEQKLDRLETKQRNGDVILPVINPGNEAGVSNCRLEQMMTVGSGPAGRRGAELGHRARLLQLCAAVLLCARCCGAGHGACRYLQLQHGQRNRSQSATWAANGCAGMELGRLGSNE